MAVATSTALAIASIAVAAAGTGVALYSADTQAKQAESNAEFQAAQAEADAKAAAGEAQVEADRIRKAAKQQRSMATAAAAASGVDVSSPTAIKIEDTITRNAEEDAVLTLLQGSDRSKRLNQQAHADRNAGIGARNAGRANQASTLLSAAGSMTNYGSGWKTAGGTS